MNRFLRASLLSLIFLPLAISLQAQMDSVAMSEEYYREGMEVYNFAHRKQATDLFVMATQYNPRNSKAQLMAGKSIMLTIKKEQSLPYFENAYRLDPKVDEDILLFIGKAFHYKEDFDSALYYYEKFNEELSRSLRFQRSQKVDEVNRKMFECRNAKIYKTHPVDVTITSIRSNVNSEWPDYAPTISADESIMVFTTRRPDDNLNPALAEDLEYYEEIFVSQKINGQWTKAKNIGPPLNTAFHNASVNLSPDGKEMFIYSDVNGGDILETDLQTNGTWTSPASLKGFINSSSHENSAAISGDGNRLFFTSDRPGGFGGTDIYLATKKKRGDWGNVKNLGPLVNSNHDEEDIYLSANGRHLYFSSNGHAGMGDLDIYRSTYDSSKLEWGEPVNLGYPINSVEDDVYFVLTGDERFAYISTVRNDGEGEQDIYRVDLTRWNPVSREELLSTMEEPVKKIETVAVVEKVNPVMAPDTVMAETKKAGQPDMMETIVASNEKIVQPMREPEKIEEPKKEEPSVVDFNLVILSESSPEPIDAKVILVDGINNVIEPNRLGPGKYAYEFNSSQFKKYTMKVDLPGYVPHRAEILLLGAAGQRTAVSETVTLKEIKVNLSFTMNFYFGYNKDVPMNMESIYLVEDLMKENPAIRIQIAGHTDNTGEESNNLLLSQRRAEGLKKLLVKNGVDGSRIITIGYGEKMPVADNATLSGRKINRRTEFTILTGN